MNRSRTARGAMGRRRGRHRIGASGGSRIDRAAGVVLLCVGVALALAAFGPSGSSAAQADQRFVEAVHAQGRTVEPGDTQALVIRAAHKLCQGRNSTTSVQRRESTLTADEVEAVRRTFGGDERAFIRVAVRTYCS